MEITIEKLIELGFKKYYNDRTYRQYIGIDIVGKPMYLTLVKFERLDKRISWTWSINPMQQFTGLQKMDRLNSVLNAVGIVL